MVGVRVVGHGVPVVLPVHGASGGRWSASVATSKHARQIDRHARRAQRSWHGHDPGHAETGGLLSVFVAAFGEVYTENVIAGRTRQSEAGPWRASRR